MSKEQIKKNWNWLIQAFVLGVIIFLSALFVLNNLSRTYAFVGIIMLIGGFVLVGGIGKTMLDYNLQLRKERKLDEFFEILFGDAFGPLISDLSNDTKLIIVPIEIPANLDFSKLKKAVVSVHANWSGPSVREGKYILKLIENSKVKDLKIYIIDINHFPTDLQKEKLGFFSQGYFESIFVKDGKIVFNPIGASLQERTTQFRKFLQSELENHQ